MRTKFPFKISIDEIEFELLYRELKKSEAKELGKEFEILSSKIDAVETVKAQIATLEEKKQAKKDIASCLKGEAKASAMQDVLDLIDAIEAKQKELKEFGGNIIDLDVTAKKRFDICLSGKDIDAFKAQIEDKGLSYVSVMSAIDVAIEKERSKK